MEATEYKMEYVYFFTIKGENGNVNALFLLVKGSAVEDWKLCGVSQKAINFNHPIQQGKGTFDGRQITLNQNDMFYAKIVFNKPLISLNSGDGGIYTDEYRRERSAVFIRRNLAKDLSSVVQMQVAA